MLLKLVDIQYDRNDIAFERGKFRVRGDVVEVWPAYEEYRLPHRAVRRRGRAAGDHQPAHRRDVLETHEEMYIYPAKHFVTAGRADPGRGRGDRQGAGRAAQGASRSRASCSKPSGWRRGRGTTWRCCWRSATARASRTTAGRSRGRKPGEPPYTLLDFFPDGFPAVRRRIARDACRRSAACSPATTAAR